jgi:hypothetical protein
MELEPGIDRFEALFAAIPNTTLYHYTSQVGFLGIINSKVLWASNILYLNDATEFAHFVDLVDDSLRHALRYERGPWNTFYGTALERFPLIKKTPIYAASFSEQGDMLSQWRAYCPDGSGFSLGFEYDFLRQRIEKQKFRIVRCVYDEAVQRKAIGDLIAFAGHLVKDDVVETAIKALLNALIAIAPAMKHPSFAEEKEWRIVSSQVKTVDPQFGVRPGKSMAVPYFKFALEDEAESLLLSDVIVGPTPHMELSIMSAENALLVAKATCRVVKRSLVPYRSW